MLYRILTEATGEMKRRAVDIAEAEFDGLTVIDATGVWLGNKEAAVVIEVAAGDGAEDRERVLRVAADIRAANHQECVMVQSVPCTWEVL